jgi:hypothetical protein
VAGSLGFAAIATLVPVLPPIVEYGAVLVAIAIGLRVVRPPNLDDREVPAELGRWDIAARMVVATTLVVSISAAAPTLGGRASGLLATFPVYIAVLSTFAHRTWGAGEAIAVLRGLLIGLPGFATFFLALSLLLGNVPIPLAFGVALLAGGLAQAATLPLLGIGRAPA